MQSNPEQKTQSLLCLLVLALIICAGIAEGLLQ